MPEPGLLDRFAHPTVAAGMLRELERLVLRPLRLMEVCGTHTMALFESGLRGALFSLGIELLSGPGCPVCVTSQVDVDWCLALAQQPDCVVCTFGDMMRVRGSRASLAEIRAAGAEIRVVYSPLDAVTLAQSDPHRRYVFLGIGFETTAPAVALAIMQAQHSRSDNFFVFSCHKTIPPALRVLAQDPALALDGFICPGHVSVIIGACAYEPVVKLGCKPCVVTGFEPLDLLAGILAAVKQAVAGEARVENVYSRVVRERGNQTALALIDDVFTPVDTEWRGLGVIPGSGLALSPRFAEYDARLLTPHFSHNTVVVDESCRCGDILKGLLRPDECCNFGNACKPETPLGACMVSQEGACRAYYRYRTSPVLR